MAEILTLFSNSGLIANIRQMRSQMARLLAGTWAAAGSVTGLKSDATTPPLLPLTVPRQNQQQQQQQRLRMKSGKPASLLLVALMILASATILPLPGLEAPSGISQKEMAADAPAVAAVGAGATASDQGVLPGTCTVVLNKFYPYLEDANSMLFLTTTQGDLEFC